MRICFSALGSGFGNNGGSKTILSCANVLADMGHDVTVASEIFDFTWFKIRAKKANKIPDDADVIIATANATVMPILKHKSNARKFWYVRGWETWAIPEAKMVDLCDKIPTIVNSIWLRDKIRKHCGKESPVIYPGLDFDIFFKEPCKKDGVVTIGGLYHSKSLKRFKLWLKVVTKVMKERKIRVSLFGNDKRPVLPIEFNYVCQPSPGQHRRFYNDCDIWFFSSENEGLHIPPMEAGLCGCALVGSDIGGVMDYAINNETTLLGDDYVGNLMKVIDNEKLRVRLSRNLISLLTNKIGSRRGNMQRLITVLSR